MQADQFVRRIANRARRKLIGGVDHDPVVEIEGSQRPQAANPWRRRMLRASKSALAFLITLALVAGGIFAFITIKSRLPVDLDGPRAEGPAAGSPAVAAAAALLQLEPELAGGGDEALFLPTERARRAAAFQEGAGEAVAAFVEVVERGRPGRDRDLAVAFDRLTAPGDDPGRFAAARDALRRFNVRDAAGRGPEIDRGRGAYAALARAAAASCGAYAAAMQQLALRAEAGRPDADAEREFMRARGQAFAWRRLLLAFSEETAEADRAGLADRRDEAAKALGAAAAYEPTLAARVRPPGPMGPEPFARLAAALNEAAEAAHALADQAEDA